MHPRPGSFVALQLQDPLQAQRTGTILLRRHPVHGAKPIGQRLPGVLKDCPCCHRRLVSTLTTLQQNRSHRPMSGARTARTAKTIRPAQPEQVFPASLLGCELLLKLSQASRIFFHSSQYYRSWLPESSEYPPARKIARPHQCSPTPFSHPEACQACQPPIANGQRLS